MFYNYIYIKEIEVTNMNAIRRIFRPLKDSRSLRNRKHKFLDIIILSILAVIAGADSYDDIVLFGKEKYKFLKKFLDLPNGIPSHDTINRLFQALNPAVFEKCFAQFTDYLKSSGVLKDHIAIDGKTSRGSKDTFKNQNPLHSVHAWSVENSLCLGQVACKDKTNEITTIPELIDMLNIKDCVITIDAMGTQTAIAEQIISKGGNYILAVKANQPSLQQKVHTICEKETSDFDSTIVEKNRGRIETRQVEVFKYDKDVYGSSHWKQLESVIKVTSTREFPDGKSTKQDRYFISNMSTNSDFGKYIRSHWEIENKLHWVLDMTFNEDASRKRAKYAAANFAIVKKMALNILKKDTSKGSLKGKRKRAGWNNNYLLELLGKFERLF
jgi:predicted transposase YbfD/YdcC